MTNSITNQLSPATLKFLYSYNGKIQPRHPDGKLCYFGGHTRVLSVNRSITFSELIVKFYEACGFSVNLKCKLPTEDLDVLVSVKCDDDLVAVVEEYNRVDDPGLKIRVILFPVETLKKISPVSSAAGSLKKYSYLVSNDKPRERVLINRISPVSSAASLKKYSVSNQPRERVLNNAASGPRRQQFPTARVVSEYQFYGSRRPFADTRFVRS